MSAILLIVVGSVAPDPVNWLVIVFPLLWTLINHWLALSSYWTGLPTSPASLSETRLIILKLVPPYTVIGSSTAASAREAASLIWVLLTLITKYTVFVLKFSGKSPSSLMIITFSPVSNEWDPMVNSKLLLGPELTVYSSKDDVLELLGITIVAELLPKNNLSFTFAPTRYPCVKTGGFILSLTNPNKYNFVLVFEASWSRVNQSMSSSVDSIALGGIICVMNALLSFSNASFLNPVDTKDNCPKLEFEFVTDASPPLSAEKCLLYPIAKTDTIWTIASFVMLMCVCSHPLR